MAVSPPPLSPRDHPPPKKKFFPLSSPLALFSLPSPSLVQSVLIAIWHLPLSPPRPSPSSPTPKVIASKARGGSAAPGGELANHIAFLRRNEWQKKFYMQAKKIFYNGRSALGISPSLPLKIAEVGGFWVTFSLSLPPIPIFVAHMRSREGCTSFFFLGGRQNGPQSSIQQTPIKTETKHSCCFAVCTVRRSDNLEGSRPICTQAIS